MSVFIPDPTFIRDFPTNPDTVAKLTERAGSVAERAAVLMPRGQSEARGHIADKFKVEVVDDEVRVGNTDPFFHLAEFGSVNNEAYAPLRRSAASLGLRFEELPKA